MFLACVLVPDTTATSLQGHDNSTMNRSIPFYIDWMKKHIAFSSRISQFWNSYDYLMLQSFSNYTFETEISIAPIKNSSDLFNKTSTSASFPEASLNIVIYH